MSYDIREAEAKVVMENGEEIEVKERGLLKFFNGRMGTTASVVSHSQTHCYQYHSYVKRMMLACHSIKMNVS